MVIYQITNIVSNNIYIGKTVNHNRRFYKHKYDAFHNKSQTYIHRAIRKYGVENFTFSILEQVDSLEKLKNREIYWIEKLNPKYNMTKGGDGGDTSNSPNFKLSMKIYHSKKNYSDYATYGMLGKRHTRKTKLEISKANSCPVSCDGKIFNSVGDAQSAFPGISIRKRLDNDKYPTFFRLRPKTKRK